MTPGELREIILKTVSKTGGHLASSLGAVELALALSETFDPFKDRIVWDVGHQAYAWKILTGRLERFSSLRQFGGISGFPNPGESKADAAIAGHAGVALSVAEGYAAARDLKGTDEQVVAVIGDSSFVNGTCLEALNNCVASCSKVIIVLNDNGMSISRPTGALSTYLGRLIAGTGYNRVKNAIKGFQRMIGLGCLHKPISRFKAFLKRILMGKTVFFEQLGVRYLGPVDGHDLAALKRALEVARKDERPVLLHVVTRKGRGFAPAEKDPTSWHGVGPFPYPPTIGQSVNRSIGKSVNSQSVNRSIGQSVNSPSWSSAFGAALCSLARENDRVVALTAAMTDGTGLTDFAAEYPSRFHDVGIAEGHMVAYAAGLAAGGLRPVVAVYSTFLQRAIDQVMHDVCLSNLPVVFAVDRAGVVGADGVTHQGVFDLAMLRCLPNLTIAQPKDEADLKALLEEALTRNGPTVIRYPRGRIPRPFDLQGQQAHDNKLSPAQSVNRSIGQSVNSQPPRFALWATGDWYERAREVAAQTGGVAVHARYLKPFDRELLDRQRAAGLKIVSLENGSIAGGLGEAIGADLKLGWPDEFIPHGTQHELEAKYSLDVEALVKTLSNFK